MQTRKTPQTWAIAGAVAAMLAASTAGVRAQNANANPTTAPGTTTTVPDSSATGATTPPGTSGAPGTGVGGSAPSATGTTGSSGSMSSSSMSGMSGGSTSAASMPGMSGGSMSSGMMDYSILSNPTYDYIDLKQAKARGLSDSQIATVAKIAQESYTPFTLVARAVERGQTFPSLASEYNLKLSDVYSADKEKQQIADYISTYESIGTKSGMGGGMMGGMMGGMSGGTDSSSMPMAPAPMAPMPTPAPAPTSGSADAAPATLDIVDTAMAAKNLTTLVKALQQAGLVDTLKGAGPFTVFAPTDQAFSRLPAGALDALMADPAKLKMVLTYHVIPAKIMASDAMAMTSPTSPPTVEGATLQVTKGRRGRLQVNDATVTKADIQASNGVIHIINRVLMPPMDATSGAATTGTGTTDTTGAGAGTGTGTGTTPAPAPAPAQ